MESKQGGPEQEELLMQNVRDDIAAVSGNSGGASVVVPVPVMQETTTEDSQPGTILEIMEKEVHGGIPVAVTNKDEKSIDQQLASTAQTDKVQSKMASEADTKTSSTNTKSDGIETVSSKSDAIPKSSNAKETTVSLPPVVDAGNETGKKVVTQKPVKSSASAKVDKSAHFSTTLQKVLASARLLKNFHEETVDKEMPQGWIVHLHKRQTTGPKEHIDRYWFSPNTGKKLRSRVEIERFLSHLKDTGGDEEQAYNLLKGKSSKKRKAVPTSVEKTKRVKKKKVIAAEPKKKGNDRQRQATAKAATPVIRRMSAKKASSKISHIAESKVKSNAYPIGDDNGSLSMAEPKATIRRKTTISSKKMSSIQVQSYPQRNPELPKVAEGK